MSPRPPLFPPDVELAPKRTFRGAPPPTTLKSESNFRGSMSSLRLVPLFADWGAGVRMLTTFTTDPMVFVSEIVSDCSRLWWW